MSFFNKITSYLTGVVLCLSLNVEAASEVGAFNPVGFRGAELFTQYSEQGKVTVYLKKYYDCGRENSAETEQVSLHELFTMYSKEGIELKKVSDTVQQNSKLQTPGHSDWGCLKVITYSAEISLGTGRSEYDITWGYKGLSTEIENLGDSKQRGFLLSVHVTENSDKVENTMPSLSSLPAFIMAAGKNASDKIEITDTDRDVVTVSVSKPYSLDQPEAATSTGSGIIEPATGEKSVQTARGPFKELNVDEKNPIGGKVFSISNEGIFNYQPADKNGKYLAAVTIKESRENKILSEHQCVFIIDVKQ